MSEVFRRRPDTNRPLDTSTALTSGQSNSYAMGADQEYARQLQNLNANVAGAALGNTKLDGDEYYRQIKNVYQRNGRENAANNAGAAATATGGYGNSYASTLGAESYAQQLQGLAAQIPGAMERLSGGGVSGAGQTTGYATYPSTAVGRSSGTSSGTAAPSGSAPTDTSTAPTETPATEQPGTNTPTNPAETPADTTPTLPDEFSAYVYTGLGDNTYLMKGDPNYTATLAGMKAWGEANGYTLKRDPYTHGYYLLAKPAKTDSGAQSPGAETPGSTTPGSTTPGSTTPGSTTPGSTTPGSTTPGLPSDLTPSDPTGTKPAETPSTETPGAETPAETPPEEFSVNPMDYIYTGIEGQENTYLSAGTPNYSKILQTLKEYAAANDYSLKKDAFNGYYLLANPKFDENMDYSVYVYADGAGQHLEAGTPFYQKILAGMKAYAEENGYSLRRDTTGYYIQKSGASSSSGGGGSGGGSSGGGGSSSGKSSGSSAASDGLTANQRAIASLVNGGIDPLERDGVLIPLGNIAHTEGAWNSWNNRVGKPIENATIDVPAIEKMLDAIANQRAQATAAGGSPAVQTGPLDAEEAEYLRNRYASSLNRKALPESKERTKAPINSSGTSTSASARPTATAAPATPTATPAANLILDLGYGPVNTALLSAPQGTEYGLYSSLRSPSQTVTDYSMLPGESYEDYLKRTGLIGYKP